jgi:ribose 5-phosphate isomerase A
MNPDQLKQKAAEAALQYIENNSIVGVGTGSTVNYFIDALAKIKGRIEATVASSVATAEKLRTLQIPVVDFNEVGDLSLYVDGTDEFTPHFDLIKGAGGALTREKILATSAKKFICIADARKSVKTLGAAPVPVEVIPMARSFVARQLLKCGGDPVYREKFITDNGNIILDVHHMKLLNPLTVEQTLNNIPGILANGIFAQRKADIILCSQPNGEVQVLVR